MSYLRNSTLKGSKVCIAGQKKVLLAAIFSGPLCSVLAMTTIGNRLVQLNDRKQLIFIIKMS